MNRVLVANRGEIAVRVIRACREAGLETVAVCSEADASSMHALTADWAVTIGPPPATDSYLSIPAIIGAARDAGADAVHPGYGFLSENAAFAAACSEAGLTFIGPSPDVIRALGDKIAAKDTMALAGVPVVPGYHGEDQSAGTLKREAEGIGTPLLIKAAAGGGGRGMRAVHAMDEFDGLLEEARREAEAAFGDARVLLERMVERPRHIEFQIFGDGHGAAVHLLERECSIQRRHQKIVEESPSPLMTPELRLEMGAAAVTVCRTAAYQNAGTVEFLVDDTVQPPRFYFLEVNTRLQVEHPVTESVTGLDLVRLQLRVADGGQLGIEQDAVAPHGHAIEVRIYAEDPSTGFLPSVGELVRWRPPEGPGIRVDSGFREGDAVTAWYDPMLAKLIVHAEHRDAAIDRLVVALRTFAVLGVETNVSYLLDIVQDPEFVAGRTHTGFLRERFASWAPPRNVPDPVLAALGSAALSVSPASRSAAGLASESDTYSPWTGAGAWRNV